MSGFCANLVALPLVLGPYTQPQPTVLPQGTVRAGVEVEEPRKVKDVDARYPADARRAGLAGDVVVRCVIDPEGRVSQATVVEGVPPLTQAALDAIEKWRYEPTVVNGVAVPVIMTVTLKFKLPPLKYYGLLGSLGEDNPHLRESAARWLGSLQAGENVSEGNIRKAIEALEPLAEADESPAVRAAAARSLSRLDGRPLPAGLSSADPAAGPKLRPLAWGTFVDPLGQSEAREIEDGIAIWVPPGLYDLSVELGRTTAPRLLRPVAGDFVVEVEVGKVSEARGRLRSQSRTGYHGAGLLLWVDGQNFVRLESATYTGGLAPAPGPVSLTRRYALFEQRAGGELLGGLDPANTGLDDAPAFLRLQRRGPEVSAFVRQGDEDWQEVGRSRILLPPEVHIGVAVVNTAGTPLSASFHGFRVLAAD